MSKKYLVGMLLVVLVGLGVLAWLERADLLAWFHVRMLAMATDANRAERGPGGPARARSRCPAWSERLRAAIPTSAATPGPVWRRWSTAGRAGGPAPPICDAAGQLSFRMGKVGQCELLGMATPGIKLPCPPNLAGGADGCQRPVADGGGLLPPTTRSRPGVGIVRVLGSHPQGAGALSNGREMVPGLPAIQQSRRAVAGPSRSV